MEHHKNEFCCGCLSSGRKMKPIRDYWNDQDFFHIFSDIPINQLALFSICWECDYQITKFIVYQKQVQSCCKVLQNFNNGDPKPHTLSNLKTCIQTPIDTSTDSQISYKNGICMKDDPDTDVKDIQIKYEVNGYSDDNKSLIDVNEEIVKKRVKKKVKKKEGRRKKKKNVFEEITLTPLEIEEERIIMAQKEDYVNAMFKCEKCIISFPNKDDLNDHTANKHDLHATKHICPTCTRSFPVAAVLLYHTKQHSQRRRCTHCPYICMRERDAKEHYLRAHCVSETFDITPKLYKNGDQEKTMNGTKSEELFSCEYCQKTFRWKTSLRKHIETHKIEAGQKRKPYCEPCRLFFTTTSNLQKHVKTSSKHQIQLKLRKLKSDDNPTQSVEDIEIIKSNISIKMKQYPCSQCDKMFQWKGNLLRHLQSHAARANGDLVCTPCNRTFSSIATYKQHMKISKKHVTENEFKYMCSDCGKRFSTKPKLRDHIDWDHLKNYTHTCTDCDKVFKSHTSLYLHKQVVHKKVNAEHLCDHCGKSFPNQTKLRSHITAIHTRLTPYKCTTCSATFSWHSCLSRHIRRVHKHVQSNT